MWQFFEEFRSCGRMLYEKDLISLKAGNLSIRQGDSIYITVSGSKLGGLNRSDIVKVPILESGSGRNLSRYLHETGKPSMELPVHKAIYEKTDFLAVAHAHPPTAVTISFFCDKIKLEDAEGKFYIPEIPVISVENPIASSEVAEKLPDYLSKSPVVMVKSHGLFAAASTLTEACAIISTVEFSSKILYRKMLLEGFPG